DYYCCSYAGSYLF
nr:immunoglobulin light chain junction region [Macaca mulatta]MOV72964.1 immunoglobulin light chain junction region [Macaca mulatta]MOV74065.1 immunoglobulin light chain junction region [Macaca mulatta]